MNEKVIVTIARQYGSGGREIGEKVAAALGIAFYDKELITMAAQKSGLSPNVLHTADEKASNSLLYTLAMGSSIYGASTLNYDIPINDRLFITQCDIIKNLAEKGSCVMVGRSADYVLRDNPRHVSVFIYAKLEDRIHRVMERHSLSEADARNLIAKTDKRRANYYNFYTGQKWGKYDNYHMSLDSSLLGIDGTAKLISQLADDFRELT
ncbi:MAG: cytidylate kinase-like family protein [Ruminococcaceae bacterium]|nr:cytidylate kinase-like family protein [Oscillospiraceae bacterium]